jgi:hypothetical protein
MEKKYKYITIKETGALEGSKETYDILNNRSGDWLGEIYYYRDWRQYVCTFNEQAVFNKSCLLDIIYFIDLIKSNKSHQKTGYMGNVTGPGCDPDVE